MAIVFDATFQSTANSYAHTCSLGATVIVMFSGGWEGDPSCAHPSACSYAGAPATFLQQCEGGEWDGKEVCGDVYALGSPQAGANNVAWSGGDTLAQISVSYEGVDALNPIDNSCASAYTAALLTGKACTCTNVVGGLGLGFGVCYFTGTITVYAPAGWAFIAELSSATSGGGNVKVWRGEIPMDSPTETYKGVSAGTTRMGGALGVAMRPEPPGRGRAIKYFYNFWDDDPKIRDESGREIPPNEIRPDNWIEAEGIALPSMEPYESFIENPSRSKIVEVNADDRSASIKTSKSQFAAVLIERAAAGRG